jgi:acetyltransferase
MEFFFDPKGVAIIGATPNPFKGGNAILRNVMGGYLGKIYPVNPNYQEMEGLPCYGDVRDIAEEVDLAIVFVPAAQVLDVVEACVARGIPGVIIESAGFAETGPEGRILQDKLAEVARRTGIRIWGPNCMGLVDAVNRRIFSFMDPRALELGVFIPGNVSLIVQSGMLSAGFLVDIMTHGIMGISKACSVGNKVDVNECDVLEYLTNDPHTAVIGMYLEAIPDGRRFLDLCRRCPKPIVVLKGGKSLKGAEAAMSHTASLAGNRRIIAGALMQAGVIEAHDFKQMMDLCRSFSYVPKACNGCEGKTAILTFSGGAGILTADFLDELGLTVTELSPASRESLQALFPSWMPVSNPVDLWPALERFVGTDTDVIKSALKAVLSDPNVDAVIIHAFAGNVRIRIDLADAARQMAASGKPVFVWLIGRSDMTSQYMQDARTYGIPVFQELYRTVECMASVIRQPRRSKAMERNPHMATNVAALTKDLSLLLQVHQGPLDEFVSKKILKAHNIPVVEEDIVEDAQAIDAVARRMGYPLVMKGLQPGVIHKTEGGLVALGIQDLRQAESTFTVLMQKMNERGKVLIQKNIPGGLEMIAGLLRDPQFGPCVMLGFGGIMAELFRDAVFAVAPLSLDDALQMMERLQGKRLLEGFRGLPPADREELARILVALGNVGLMHPRIHEIDINPLILARGGAVAVDATIMLS